MIRKENSQLSGHLDISEKTPFRHVAQAVVHFTWALAILAGCLFLSQNLLAFSNLYIQTALAAFLILILAICGGLVFLGKTQFAPGWRFGAANAVTLGRGVLICLIGGGDWPGLDVLCCVGISRGQHPRPHYGRD